MHGQQITSLPAEIDQLTQLTTLHLNHNRPMVLLEGMPLMNLQMSVMNRYEASRQIR